MYYYGGYSQGNTGGCGCNTTSYSGGYGYPGYGYGGGYGQRSLARTHDDGAGPRSFRFLCHRCKSSADCKKFWRRHY